MLCYQRGPCSEMGGLKAGIGRSSAISPAAHWVSFAGLSPPSSLINRNLNSSMGMVCGRGPVWVRGVLSHTTLPTDGGF